MRNLLGRIGWLLTEFAYIALALGCASAMAQEPRQKLLVAQDGSGTHRAIQSAIDVAASGALIEIKPGTYRENLSIEKPLELKASAPTRTVRSAFRSIKVVGF